MADTRERQTYGILGWPVAHSRSPQMQAAAFASAGLEADYVRFAVRPERLADAVTGLDALGVQGANVTLPHKQAVIELLAETTPEARAIGAVNTLVRRSEGGFTGHNTDAPGLAQSLIEGGVTLKDAAVVVLGAGGAARAAVVGIAGQGAKRIHIAARRPEQAEQLASELAAVCPNTSLGAGSTESLDASFGDIDLLAQSTSATLEGNPQAQPFADSLPMHALPSHAAVVDLVYQPMETSVLAAARARGLVTVAGLGMLIHQGALAFELWTGQSADVPAMTQALRG